MFGSLNLWKSGKEIKDGAKARIAANELNYDLPGQILAELGVLSRNIRDDDKYSLTVDQLITLGL